MKSPLCEFKLMQDGVVVAYVTAPNEDAALCNIAHYAMILQNWRMEETTEPTQQGYKQVKRKK